jgi:probable HAF family extracellular repeat protein
LQPVQSPTGSEGFGVNADGSVVVGSASIRIGGSGHHQAFRWTEGGGPIVSLGTFPNADPPRSLAYAVSRDGNTVTGWSAIPKLNGNHAFLWTPSSGMQDIGDFPGGLDSSAGRAISGDGHVIVGSGVIDGQGQQQRAARWIDGGTPQQLGVPAGVTSASATAVSYDGAEVAGVIQFGNDTRAVRWTPAGMTELGSLPDRPLTVAYGMSDDGNVIVGQAAFSFFPLIADAFYWTEAQGMRPLSAVLADAGLNVTGWRFDIARDVSADGLVIVGEGRDPTGAPRGFVAVIPEPSFVGLVPLGFALRRRRRSRLHPAPSEKSRIARLLRQLSVR